MIAETDTALLAKAFDDDASELVVRVKPGNTKLGPVPMIWKDYAILLEKQGV